LYFSEESFSGPTEWLPNRQWKHWTQSLVLELEIVCMSSWAACANGLEIANPQIYFEGTHMVLPFLETCSERHQASQLGLSFFRTCLITVAAA
jgi:hypothetical protein